MAMASASCKKPRGGELGLERGKRCERREGEGNIFPDRWQPSSLPTIYPGAGAQQWRQELVSMAVIVCGEKGSGREANELQERAPEGSRVLILMVWTRCRVNFGDDDWAREAVFLMRRCELSPVLGVARAAAHGFNRGTVRFSLGAREMACGSAGLVS
jgi:hypothetical protein